MPQSLLCVGSIVRNEKIPDQPLIGIGLGLEVPYIEETAIHMVRHIHPIFIVQNICYLLEHYAEEDSEESPSQDTTLLHTARALTGHH